MDLEMIVLASSREPRLNQFHLKNYDCKTWTVLLSNAVVVYRTLPGQTSDDHIQRLRRRIFCEDMDGCPLDSLGLDGINTELGQKSIRGPQGTSFLVQCPLNVREKNERYQENVSSLKSEKVLNFLYNSVIYGF